MTTDRDGQPGYRCGRCGHGVGRLDYRCSSCGAVLAPGYSRRLGWAVGATLGMGLLGVGLFFVVQSPLGDPVLCALLSAAFGAVAAAAEAADPQGDSKAKMLVQGTGGCASLVLLGIAGAAAAVAVMRDRFVVILGAGFVVGCLAGVVMLLVLFGVAGAYGRDDAPPRPAAAALLAFGGLGAVAVAVTRALQG